MNEEISEYLEQEQEHFQGTDLDQDSIDAILEELLDGS